ncbi:MAG TPA: ABC transporter permease [Blastocatellia bacterium]|nr:ABC transporter permease [Blastocatellia bacterium]
MPDWRDEIRQRLAGLKLEPTREAEIIEELSQHLDDRYAELCHAGASDEAAYQAALAELSTSDILQRELRRVEQTMSREAVVLGAGRRKVMENILQDVRYGLRTLRNRPGFSATVIFVLALGIGATTAIFSVVNAVLLRRLPYPQPERLMMIFTTADRDGQRENEGPIFGPDFVEWREQCQSCEQMAAYIGTWPGNLTGGTEPERVRIARVTDGLFATLGVKPLLGRTFLPQETGRPLFGSDTAQAGNTAVILSYGVWQRRFNGDPEVIDRVVRVEGDNCTVVGVMPNGFNYPGEAEVWLPAALGTKRDNAFLRVVARLQPGVTQAEAQAEMTTIARRLEQAFPQTNRGMGVNLVPLQTYIVGDVRTALLVFLGAVGFVLLIACANVANLLLARAATRQKEMAIRAALGASRWRIVQQLLIESLLLALLGGALGLVLASWGLNLLVAAAPQEIPRLNAITIDVQVLGFTLLISMLTGIIFGLAPALQASKPDLNTALKDGGRTSGGTLRHRLRNLLVVAEVSLALVLLIGGGLLLKSFMRLRDTSLGFNPDHLLTASITLPEAAYPKMAQVKTYYQQALARLGARQEARAVGIASALPLGKNGARIQGDLQVEGEAAERPGVSANKLAVSAGYFEAMGIPLLKGRMFDDRDTESSSGVLIISESLARALWPDEDAIGKRLNIGFRGETWREVVGIVGDVRQNEIGAPLAQALYQPFLQVADSRRWMLGDATFVARTAGDAEGFAATLRSELQAIDKDLPLYDVAAMPQVIAQKVADPRFYTLLLGGFSGLALLLAAAGIYGVISYSVSQRTHEIGVRMALGAQAVDVVRLVVAQGMKLVLLSLVIGLAGAYALTRVLEGFLYQVSVTDPATFALLSLLLALVALAACYVPARRATKIDPLAALRYE